ncbi:MAG: hypothetical protein B5766_02085 [Candidatus Lumbricidophila eiseniae]|uniref:Uncharacterized protein n=1 Tax=Candidatus Lumbricidiphila eiseniae TaxID=1969409 RepID=A0A2A6FUB9_9MICO|nr:MAG: hypothetical protein B5766_02085 [Candidatus Lumbricidophila eiseniae]
MLDEMDVVYGWFERTRNTLEDNILAGKIVPIGCLVQFQALGSIADYLSVHTLQFGYKLGLVDARAVVELMTDREQRGIVLSKTELRLASLRETELDEVSLLFTDSEPELRANRVANAFWRWWMLRSLVDYRKSRKEDPTVDMFEFQIMWGSGPNEFWQRYYQPPSSFSTRHSEVRNLERFAERTVRGLETELWGAIGVTKDWFDAVRDTIADMLTSWTGERVPISQSAKFQTFGPETDDLSLDTLQFGYRIGLIDARFIVRLMADRKQRHLPLTEIELRLASLPDNELYEIPLIFNDPDTELRTNSAARAFWRWYILRLLFNKFKPGLFNPYIDLAELEIAWDHGKYIDDEIEGGSPIGGLWEHFHPRGRDTLFFGKRARTQFFEKFEQWLTDNQPTT